MSATLNLDHRRRRPLRPSFWKGCEPWGGAVQGDRSLIHRLATLLAMVEFFPSAALAGWAATGIMLPFGRKVRSRWQAPQRSGCLPGGTHDGLSSSDMVVRCGGIGRSGRRLLALAAAARGGVGFFWLSPSGGGFPLLPDSD